MLYNLECDAIKIEEVLHEHLSKPFIRPRDSFDFVTLKGNPISISIQTGITYRSSPAVVSAEHPRFESVEILSRKLHVTKQFRKKYENYSGGPLDFVPVEKLAKIIKHNIEHF